jgi:hypothetical protein
MCLASGDLVKDGMTMVTAAGQITRQEAGRIQSQACSFHNSLVSGERTHEAQH